MFDPGPKVQLGWQDNTWNEAGFDVLRKNGQPSDPGDYVLVGNVGQNQTQFIDATVAPESTYTYRVFAYNQYGQNGSNTATIAVPVPVELISFTAEVDGNVVTLFWQTATETNNSGFEIERAPSKSTPKGETSGWQRIGFVEGKGTTTEIQSYSFTDKPEPGKYKYRLKQIDFGGTFAYSPEVEAEVKAPNVFSLERNYPNPFNPSTKIKYSIPDVALRQAQSAILVTLKVYDILGNEVATLVNGEQTAGAYEVEFLTSSGIRQLVSGIYFYQLKAGSFIETKKMMLLK
ncbi:MAG: T9SS type A sorting domain-containing protein [Ignavibacteriaceae bacterium]|nr:T9SS type A sorting domain-containing protein [Ignavibacteriaceae bacterium]